MCRRPARALAAALLAAGAARAGVLHVPGDFPTVAEALAAAQPGDEVVLAAGSYDTPILVQDLTDVVLRGQGKVVLGGGTALTPALTISDCDGVTVENLRIEGALGLGVLAGSQANDVTLRRLRITGPAGDGIEAGESTGLLLDRCRVEGAGGDGIAIVLAEDVTISRCTVVDAGGVGIEVSEVSAATVDRCHVKGTGQSGIALGSDPTGQSAVTRNVVLDAGLHGIHVLGDDNVVRDNRVLGAASAGVLFAAGSDGGVVEDNRIVGASVGIDSSCTGLLLRDNRIVAPLSQGLAVKADGSVLHGNRVIKALNDAFVFAAALTSGSVTGCKAVKPDEDGFLNSGDGLVFTGNVATGAGDRGFAVAGDANVYAGNTSHGSGLLGLEDTGVGNIYLDNDFADPAQDPP